MKTIPLGFEVGTGAPIAIPLKHLAVTGQTQESGKTTTLEALAMRAGIAVLAFVTKRGEGSFREGHRVAPYFRDRADWQFVTSIIDATLQEKNKFLRPWIMKICRTTRSLADVQERVREALRTAKGIHEGVYTQLDAYLDLIVPEIRRAKLAPSLVLAPGLNVMDVSASTTPMQMLFVQSALDWVNAHARDTVVVIPEAWEFVPEAKGSPAKASAIALVRKGGGIGNHIWVDSQDMAGVDKTILRGCAVWLIGVQREANELKRNLANIPASIKRPTLAEVATLGKGEFYACWGRHAIKVYVQPAWMEADQARAVAMGEDLPSLPPGSVPEQPEEDEMSAEERARCEEEIKTLKRAVDELSMGQGRLDAENARLKGQLRGYDEISSAIAALRKILGAPAVASSQNGVGVDLDAVVSAVLSRLPAGSQAVYTVAPVEKLRKDYQQREVERILESVKAFTVTQKDILALVEMTSGFISQPDIAKRLGKGMGGWLAQHVKPMVDQGFLELVERQGVRSRLKQKIAEDLAHYGATEEEVAAVHQQVLARVASGELVAGGARS